jgi:hypothetical protein
MEAEKFFKREWQHGGRIRRLHGSPYTLNVDTTTRGFLPETAIGRLFNLTLTALTLGSWLIVWFFWALAVEGSRKDFVHLTAYPEGEGADVDVMSNNEAWHKDVEAWLDRAFS